MQGLLTVCEVARLLNLSSSTIRAWLSRGKLPRVSCGRAVRIPAEAVRKFIEENTIPALPARSRTARHEESVSQ
jgi:excisionase family DNA binding protein